MNAPNNFVISSEAPLLGQQGAAMLALIQAQAEWDAMIRPLNIPPQPNTNEIPAPKP